MKLIRQFLEGAKIYKCSKCGREVTIAKDKMVWCLYCGNKNIDK